MELTDWEELLWETGRVVSGQAADEPSREELAAYREGRLPSEVAENVEKALGHAAGGRRQLAELAGVEPAQTDPRVREAFLTSFDVAARTSKMGRLMVQAALVAMGLAVLWLTRSPERLPADLAYDVEAEGLAAVRRPPATSRRVEAYPDTRIRITVSPRPAALREVEFGLYVRSGRLLERQPLDAGVELKTIRGAAVVEARARDLADPAEADAEIFVAAARPGDLPRRFVLDSSDAASVIAANGRRRAYSVEIRFRAPPQT